MKEIENIYCTYALYSYDSSRLYIGQTNNLIRRLREHNKGKVESTKLYRPYKLIYVEEHLTRENAVKREKELKTTKGRKFLKQLI